MNTHDATEATYKNGYQKGFSDAETIARKRAEERKMKKYLLTVLSYIALAVVSVSIVCARMNATKKQVINEIKQEIYKSVEPKVLKIIEKDACEASEPETALSKKSLGEFKLTAYCSCEKCCGVWAKNRPTDKNGNVIVVGSVGIPLVPGVSVAVDPSVIPYGSLIEINGKEYSADDCGGAINGNRIDVYFAEHEEALRFGVQYAEVFVRC